MIQIMDIEREYKRLIEMPTSDSKSTSFRISNLTTSTAPF